MDGKCCFCSGECNPLSQSCGLCPREAVFPDRDISPKGDVFPNGEDRKDREIDNDSVKFIAIRGFFNSRSLDLTQKSSIEPKKPFFVKEKEDVYVSGDGDKFVLEVIQDGEDDYRFEYFINGKEVGSEGLMNFLSK